MRLPAFRFLLFVGHDRAEAGPTAGLSMTRSCSAERLTSCMASLGRGSRREKEFACFSVTRWRPPQDDGKMRTRRERDFLFRHCEERSDEDRMSLP